MTGAPLRAPLAHGRLLDSAALARTMSRLAHEVSERHPGLQGVVVAAIRDGGVPLARLLVATLAEMTGITAPLVALDVAAHRDDRPRPQRPVPGAISPLAARADATPPAATASIDGATVVLVDDVLHTGRTLRAALDCLADAGRPAAVEPLVLLDRGQRELPLRATYVGRNVPVAADEWVEVLVWDGPGAETGAWLVKRALRR